MFLVAWQALLQVLGEGVGADVAEHVDMAVVAFGQALEAAVLLGAGEELVDLLQQAVVLAGGHSPAQVLRIAEVEGDPYIGEVHLVHRQLVGIDQGQVDLPFVDHAQQVDHLDFRGFLVLQLRRFGLERGQLFGVAAALEHQDAFAEQVLGAGGALLTVAVDDLRGDLQVGLGEACELLPSIAGHQAGGRQHRPLGLAEAGEQLVEVVGGFDLQFDIQILGEALEQLVLEAGFAIAVLEIGGGAVAGDHAQHAVRLDALECAGFFNTAVEQQEDPDR